MSVIVVAIEAALLWTS